MEVAIGLALAVVSTDYKNVSRNCANVVSDSSVIIAFLFVAVLWQVTCLGISEEGLHSIMRYVDLAC